MTLLTALCLGFAAGGVMGCLVAGIAWCTLRGWG